MGAALAVQGHPLGNFTLNQSIILELSGQQVWIHALVDFAEIPSFEQFSSIDADEDRRATREELDKQTEGILAGLSEGFRFLVDGEPVEMNLRAVNRRLSRGVAGVTCIQYLVQYTAMLPDPTQQRSVHLLNGNYTERRGKTEIRILWSPDIEVSGVEAAANSSGTEAVINADREDSLLLDNARETRFYAQAADLDASRYTPIADGFSDTDTHVFISLVPQDVLIPDADGSYEIIHVRLAEDVKDGKSVSALKPRALSGLPAIPGNMVGTAQDEETAAPQTSSQRPREGDQKLGDAERKFSNLIHTKDLSPSVLLGLIFLSMLYGAAHALSPGHGKTVVAAYLVGTQGKLWKGIVQAMYLGLIVTLSHVFVVLAIGIITLKVAAGAVSDQVTIWLQIASGLMVISIGIPMLIRRMRVRMQAQMQEQLLAASASAGASTGVDAHEHGHHEHGHHEHGHHEHGHHEHGHHEHGHGHGHGHGHSHDMPADATWWDLLVLGVTGGMVPCLGAVMVFLVGVGFGRAALGLMLIVSFSIGLAAVLIAIGITMVVSRRLLNLVFDWVDRRLGRTGGTSRSFFRLTMPVIAAGLVTLLGVGICLRALIQGGILVINF